MDTPEDTSGRRGCVLVGALLGVAAGVLIALFAVPPLFDHYFGTADVKLGDSHTDAGRTVRVEHVEVGPDFAGTMVLVALTIETETAWDIDLAAVTVELDNDINIAGATAKDATGSIEVVPGAPVRVEFLVARPAGSTALPRILRLGDIKARFYLQPGEPK